MVYVIKANHRRKSYGTSTPWVRPHDSGSTSSIQHSQASIGALASRYSLNAKTVAKWKKRDFVTDAPMGPKHISSTVLSKEEEAICVAFRKHTLLPLDDCLYALQATIPHLSRHHYIGVFNDMGSTDYQRLKERNPQKRNSRVIP